MNTPNQPDDANDRTQSLPVDDLTPPGLQVKYHFEQKLGKGGFGVVFRAWHTDLRQYRAVKRVELPHAPAALERLLAEAQILGGFRHPGIVEVYDVERPGDGFAYIVAELIDGCDLKETLKKSRPSVSEAVRIVREIAESLHYAHLRGVIHRDVKPANIMLRKTGKAVLVDFGLALREEDQLERFVFGGTLQYMSPEQVRREGHRIGPATDIFSLGVVLYELLAGERPFLAERGPLESQICHAEPRRLREINPDVPAELERITLKALAKATNRRFATAALMAEDLARWAAGELEETVTLAAPPAAPVVFKGLLSFDSRDKDFFLELLPGPRDREGLPESIRFWKSRIETPPQEPTFRVGLLLGASGSGKSSLIRAGLIPRLGRQVRPWVLETHADELETRILRRLQQDLPGTLPTQSLPEVLKQIRRQGGLPDGRKLLLVLDQFEQWLARHDPSQPAPLVDALRQCDGTYVQALLLVRDDFTLAATQLMQQLEEPLRQEWNFAAQEPFGERHAQLVLTTFGQTLGALTDPVVPEAQNFIREIVGDLAADGPLLPIRIALVVGMLKEKPWTPGTLRSVGGLRGLGVAFLEEKLCGATALPLLRTHPRLVRELLQCLLPEGGGVIRGPARTRSELHARLARMTDERTLDEVLNALDLELRLITVTGPRTSDEDSRQPSDSGSQDRETAYQLAHDYLVPALRQWLTHSEQATLAGRARLLLKERAEAYAAQPERRHLPTPGEYLRIAALTGRATWSESQRRVMRAATKHHGKRLAAWTAALALLISAAALAAQGYREQVRDQQARQRVDSLLTAEIDKVPSRLAEIDGDAERCLPKLQRAYDDLQRQSESDSPAALSPFHERRNAALALARPPLATPRSGEAREWLLKKLPELGVEELRQTLPVFHESVFQALPPEDRKRELSELWTKLRSSAPQRDAQALALGSLLALWAPRDKRWEEVAPDLAAALVAAPLRDGFAWASLLTPASTPLARPLLTEFRQSSQAAAGAGPGSFPAAGTAAATPQERRQVLELLLQFAGEDDQTLADALEVAEPDGFPLLMKRAQQLDRDKMKQALEVRFAGNLTPPPELASGRQPLAAELAQQIAACGGSVGQQAIVVPRLPIEQLPKLAQDFGQAGYRPVSLRPFWVESHRQVAGAWLREGQTWNVAGGDPSCLTGTSSAGRGWEFRYDLTAAQLQAAGEPAAEPKPNWQIVDFSFDEPKNVESGPQLRWSGLWMQTAEKTTPVRFYVDKPCDDHRRCQEKWPEESYWIEKIAVRVDPERGPLVSALWTWQPQAEDLSAWPRVRPLRASGDLFPGMRQTDVRIHALDLAHADTYEACVERYEELQKLEKEEKLTTGRVNALLTLARYQLAEGNAATAFKTLEEALRGVEELTRDESVSIKPDSAARYKSIVAELQLVASTRQNDPARFSEAAARLPKAAGANASPSAILLELRKGLFQKDPAAVRASRDALAKAAGDRPEDREVQIKFAWAELLLAAAAQRNQDAEAGALLDRDIARWREVYPRAAPSSSSFREELFTTAALRFYLPEDLTDSPDFAPLRTTGGFQKLLADLSLDRRCCAVWQERPREVSWLVLNKSLEVHQAEAQRLLEDGFRPVCLAVAPTLGEPGLGITSVWTLAVPSSNELTWQARRQANLALALNWLGDSRRLVELFATDPWPTSPQHPWRKKISTWNREARWHAQVRAAASGLPVQNLTGLRDHADPDVRRSLLLTLGDYAATAELTTQWSAWIEQQRDQDQNAALQSAARWCAARWQLPERAAASPAAPPQGAAPAARTEPWFVNPVGQIMIRVQPGREFLRGSPASETDRAYEMQLWLTNLPAYYLAATEVTVAQFDRFLDSDVGKALYPKWRFVKRYAPSADCPQTEVTWLDAARYCQWLSLQAGYRDEEAFYPDILKNVRRRPGEESHQPPEMTGRRGYHLPLEVQWEYAARAGSPAARHYGTDQNLLPATCWFLDNAMDRTHGVAQLRPNEYGFFDMLGNVTEWCHESYVPYTIATGSPLLDARRLPGRGEQRVTRGGNFESPPRELRSADRSAATPINNRYTLGFRPACSPGTGK